MANAYSMDDLLEFLDHAVTGVNACGDGTGPCCGQPQCELGGTD